MSKIADMRSLKNVVVLYLFLIITGCSQKESGSLILFDPGSANPDQVRSITGDQITFNDRSVVLNFAGDQPTSIIEFSPEEGTWDASDYRFVRCEIENTGTEPQLVELGFGGYDLTQGATIVSPGAKKSLKAVIYRSSHPDYIDRLFPVMHGKPDGILRGWMATTFDSIVSIKLLFPEMKPGASVRVGRIWLEESYVLYPEEELKDMFYPFVDKFGQYMYDEWPDKIHSVKDLKAHQLKESEELDKMNTPSEWNQYGGWAKGPQLKASGRFRVEKVDGKWWFVDPEGKLFWSHGMDCVEFGRQTRTRISDREHLFQDVPDIDSPEGALYSYSEAEVDTTLWLSFHALNLFRHYGDSWKEISANRLHTRFRNWGMNTIGNWSDPNIYLQRKTPYVLTAYTQKTGLIADPYAEGFQENLVETLGSKREELGDPWCMGVFVDNELKWGVKWGSKIPEQILVAPPDQPAKLQFIEQMEAQYQTIQLLNNAWSTDFLDWNGLLGNEKIIPGAKKDMREFMKMFTALYYSSCREAVKAVDPEMLYLGCRMDFHLYPEDTSLNYIIKIASEYCDVVSFNRYRYTCSGLLPPDDGDFPIIIGEFHFGSLETGLLQPGLRYAAGPMERAAFYKHYVGSALQNPYIVGTHWFQLADQSVTGRSDGENYQAGFLTVGDVPQREIIEVSRELGHNMYRSRYNVNGKPGSSESTWGVLESEISSFSGIHDLYLKICRSSTSHIDFDWFQLY